MAKTIGSLGKCTKEETGVHRFAGSTGKSRERKEQGKEREESRKKKK